MREKKLVSLTILLSLVALGVISARVLSAQQKTASLPQWEYCALTETFIRANPNGSDNVVTAVVRYSKGGVAWIDGKEEQDAMFTAMQKLGDEGWEMAGEGPRSFKPLGSISINSDGSGNANGGGTIENPFVIYFKRPKR